ncbi:hypothetical protein VIGAN_02156100 [Vigna angularis var. angularis]|uniref:Histidine kinase/HSP90-like ATPase domain-containing protein n=1 Tax=Vigna angularis var. angularis TaxID=157739 RepID=A0A0S3REH7_PHAAN|nr:hypothetical protein VIGAN_02156100 [Vigna angularis var. angularis]
MEDDSHVVLDPSSLMRALDKIRFESLIDKSKLDAQPELFIHIILDKTNNTFTIIDSGVGMTKAELCNNNHTATMRVSLPHNEGSNRDTTLVRLRENDSYGSNDGGEWSFD